MISIKFVMQIDTLICAVFNHRGERNIIYVDRTVTNGGKIHPFSII